ncbi:MAG: glycosyltransferase family 9 protein, partial [Bryobacteraceae bacterium]
TAGPEEPLDNAHRFDSLYDLACWLMGASLYAGNDSGITHLAAAIGVPVVAIFRASDPAIWAPRGPGSITILGGNGGEDVAVADAHHACRRLLDARGSRGV